MIIFLKNNWPLILIGFYFIYRQLQSRKIKKMIPSLINEGAVLIDVRSHAEYNLGHANGTINIPLNNFTNEINQFSKDQTIIVCCASGTRSAMARKILQSKGYKKTFNAGAWRTLAN